MRIEIHHCLLILLLVAVTHVLVSGSPTVKININAASDDNCTREGDVLICPCNVTVNGTYYPCWVPINNGTTPNITCNECQMGSFSNNATVNCTTGDVCPLGTCLYPYSCDPCSPGTFTNITGSTQCSICTVGYVSREGAHNCTACGPGFSTEGQEGLSSCYPCTPGYYSTDFASAHCMMCDIGTYSGGKATGCITCGQGTYNDKKGQGSCHVCGEGYYSAALGLTSKDQCHICPAGSYCPDQKTVAPLLCPRNHYCGEGSARSKECSLLYESEPGRESCKPGAGFYIVIFGSIGVAAIFFGVVWKWRAVQRERLRREYRQTEIDRLIPKPRDGPVYTGF